MKRKKYKILTAGAILFAIAASAFLFPLPASAGGAVDLSHVRQNESGAGYVWDNINDVLTLTDANIVTDKDFGIKLPSGATVVVEGNCTVSAAKYGISCPGSVTFKGTGKLTVTGGECGMYFYLSVREDRVLFLSGDYTVAGGEYGIRSDGAEISVCGGKTTFRGETAVSGVTVTFSDCESVADGGVYAQRLVRISGADLSATAENRAAIVSDGKIDVKDEKIEAGDAGALSAVDGYEGQSAVRFTSVYRRVRTSVLFGETVPGWVDVLVFTAAGLAAAAAIAVPLIRKNIKKKKLYERLGE